MVYLDSPNTRLKYRKRLRDWYASALGRRVLMTEKHYLNQILPDLFGYHIIQLGRLGGDNLLKSCRIQHQVLIDSACCPPFESLSVLAQLDALPIAGDSVDAVVLPHILEFEHNSHDIVREVERILIPEGHIVVLGFNPLSLLGLWRFLHVRSFNAPWHGRLISQSRLRDWLALMGFEIKMTTPVFFGLRAQQKRREKVLQAIQDWGRLWWPFFFGVYVVVAKKRVSTLTPIKPRWRPRETLMGAGVMEASSRTGNLSSSLEHNCE